MKKLKKIKIFSFARFQASLMALVGILCGILYSFGGLLIDILVTLGLISSEVVATPGLSSGTLLAFGALIGMPVIFFIAGFFTGIVEAVLYNIFARLFVGLQIDFDINEKH